MQADLLEEPSRTQVKQLLRDYVQLRSRDFDLEGIGLDQQVAELLQGSEHIQNQLWSLAVKSNLQLENSLADVKRSEFLMVSVLALTDIHYTRLHSAVMNRIPLTIWITLYLMAVLAMIIMGYQAGLTNRRSPIATVTLAVAFAAVIILIADLDRPIMSFFEINQQLLLDLYENMEADVRLEYIPAD
jgi:hypothetical protein